MAKNIDQAPYRTALEALISRQAPTKLSGLLANAAAQLDDPNLRDALEQILQRLNSRARIYPREPLSIREDIHGAEEVITYIKDVIDARELAWERIAAAHGWLPPEAEDEVD